MSLGLLAFLHFAPLLTSFEKGLPPRDNFLVSSNTAFGCSLALGLCYNFTPTLSPVPCFCTKAGEALVMRKCFRSDVKAGKQLALQRCREKVLRDCQHQERGRSRHRKARSQGSVSIQSGFQPRSQKRHFHCKPVCNPTGLT